MGEVGKRLACSVVVLAALVTPALAGVVNDSIAVDEDAPGFLFDPVAGTNGASADSFAQPAQITSVTQGAHGSVSLAFTGNVINYVPAANYFGTDSFTYTVTAGAVVETGTVTVTVVVINDPPVVMNNNVSQHFERNTPLDLVDIVIVDDSPTITVELALSGAAPDYDGILSLPTSGAVVPTFNITTGVWSVTGTIAQVNEILAAVVFTPTTNFVSETLLLVRVLDGPYGIQDGKVLTPFAVIAPAALSGVEDTSITFTNAQLQAIAPHSPNNIDVILSTQNRGLMTLSTTTGLTFYTNPGDGDGTDDQRMFFFGSVADVNAALDGLVLRPRPDVNGTFTFTLQINVGADATSAQFTVTLAAVTDIVNDHLTVVENGSITFDPILGTNGANADTFSIGQSYQSFTQGTLGTVTRVGQELTYTPMPGVTGTDTFMFTVATIGPTNETGTVTIDITAAALNAAPMAVSDAAILESGGTIEIEVLANDTDDVGLDVGSVTIVTAPSHGLTTVNGDGTVTYVSSGDGAMADAFTYRVNDAEGLVSGDATVIIEITNTDEENPDSSSGDGCCSSSGAGNIPLGFALVLLGLRRRRQR